MSIVTLSSWDTDWPSDSVETCPEDSRIIACSTYLLDSKSEEVELPETSSSSSSSAIPTSSSKARKRGRITLLERSASNDAVVPLHTLSMGAVFDVKWFPTAQTSSGLLAAVTSGGARVNLCQYSHNADIARSNATDASNETSFACLDEISLCPDADGTSALSVCWLRDDSSSSTSSSFIYDASEGLQASSSPTSSSTSPSSSIKHAAFALPENWRLAISRSDGGVSICRVHRGSRDHEGSKSDGGAKASSSTEITANSSATMNSPFGAMSMRGADPLQQPTGKSTSAAPTSAYHLEHERSWLAHVYGGSPSSPPSLNASAPAEVWVVTGDSGVVWSTSLSSTDIESSSSTPLKSHLLWTGADDALMKGWDLRTDCLRPTFANTSHGAGVCCIQFHPRNEHLAVSGSYDEIIRLWDKRSMQKPIREVDAGGGVWRLKWRIQEHEPDLLLAACMHGGFRVFRIDSGDTLIDASTPTVAAHAVSNSTTAAAAAGGGGGGGRGEYEGKAPELTCLAHYREHASLAYGADWIPSATAGEPPLIGTSSFYDHLFKMWRYA